MSKKKKKKLGRKFGESNSPVPTSYLKIIFHIEVWAKISKNYSNLQYKNKILQIFPLFLCRKIAKFRQKKKRKRKTKVL
jgi:hypothetical protein